MVMDLHYKKQNTGNLIFRGQNRNFALYPIK